MIVSRTDRNPGSHGLWNSAAEFKIVSCDINLRRWQILRIQEYRCEKQLQTEQEDDPQHFRKIEDVPVQKLVHSLAVDPSTYRVYAPEQEENGQAVARIVIYEPRSK